VHILLFAVIMVRSSELYILNSKWKALASQRKALDQFKSEFAVISQDSKDINQLVAQRVNWSEKLNKLSLGLPGGVWFDEIAVSKNNFLLRGSVVSLQRQEMNLIKAFIDN
jgi:Tfp pilus assembly protein PilN